MIDRDESAPGPGPDVLAAYLKTVEAWGNALPADRLPGPDEGDERRPGWIRRLARGLLPPGRLFALRYRLQHDYTSAIRSRERRRAAVLADRSPLRLHLGCGPYPKPGWVNIDLSGHPVDLRWNLERPLPFKPGSVDAIFHEHLLEHLPLSTGLEFLRANYRLLRPGGVLRVVVPDAGAYLESYGSGGDGLLRELRSDRPTKMLAINELFYMYTHVAMFDAETLTLFLRAAGFDHVERMDFGESRLDPCPDSEHRRPESLYLEAVR